MNTETKNVLIGISLLFGGLIVGTYVGVRAGACAICNDPTKCTDILTHCK